VRAVLVTGATGTLGRLVMARFAEIGVDARGLSRRPRTRPGTWVVGDLAGNEGVPAAVDGVEVIVHCASDPRSKGAEVRTTTNLVDAARAGGLNPTLVYISIVGVDRVPMRYYREKLETERLIEGCGLPWTILRTTQFHDLVALMAGGAARSPIVPALAGVSAQPIETGEVARRLVELAGEPAQGRAADMGGPEVRSSADLVRTYLRAVGKRRLVVPLHVPGALGRALRAGGLLAPGGEIGRTFEEYLADRVTGGVA
jgi:uncharacterized protein YbjT (DUF2867 family)